MTPRTIPSPRRRAACQQAQHPALRGGPGGLGQIWRGPAPSHPVLRRGRQGQAWGKLEKNQPPIMLTRLPLPALCRRRSCPKGLGLWAGWGQLAQYGCWMQPPHREGPACLPQCLPMGLFPDRLVLESRTRATEPEYKEMTGEEQLIAL